MKDELIKFIDKLKGENDAILKYSEESTKLGIILPLLQHLGWDPFDTSTIYPEYPVRRGKVDYSIRDGKKSKVFIEVKKVSEDLDKHDEQLLQYSFGESVEMAILTNGITWLFYLPQKLGIKWEQRKFFTINIFDQASNMVARAFIDYLSRENVISGKHVENAENVLVNEQTRKLILKTLPDVWEKILTDPHPRLMDLIADETEKKCGHRPDGSMIKNYINQDILKLKDIPRMRNIFTEESKHNIIISKEEIEMAWKENRKPKLFKFKGKNVEVSSWKDLYKKIIGIILQNNIKDSDRILELKGRKRTYFAKDSKGLKDPKEIPFSGFYINGDLTTNDIQRILYNILDMLSYSLEDFSFEWPEN